MGGRKDDGGKAPIHLIPPEALFSLAKILDFGQRKYEARNWEKGLAWSRCFGAANRHLWYWWGGAAPSTKNFMFGEIDDETGYSHLWHCLACIVFLVTYEERQIGEDDRPR